MAAKIYYMTSEYVMERVRFRDIIPQFCKHSTVHGVQHIGKTAGEYIGQYLLIISFKAVMSLATSGNYRVLMTFLMIVCLHVFKITRQGMAGFL